MAKYYSRRRYRTSYRRYQPRFRKYRPYKYSGFELILAIGVLVTSGGVLAAQAAFEQVILAFMVFVGILSIVAVGLLVWFSYQQIRRQRAIKLAGIDQMDGVQFEQYLKFLLEQKGFKRVVVTSAQGDFGADLIAEQDGVKYAVQAKRYHGLVGVDAIYQVIGGEKYYDCSANMVITNSRFTRQARDLAEKTGTDLIDREVLGEWIGEVNSESEKNKMN